MINFTRRSLLFAAPAIALRAAPKLRLLDLRTISMQPELYHGWPTVVRARSGDLLLVYSGGRESHVCPFGRVDLMRSHDEGKTWSWPETLLDTAIDDRDAGICETASGAWLVTTFTSLTRADETSSAPNRSRHGKRSTGESRPRLGESCWTAGSCDPRMRVSPGRPPHVFPSTVRMVLSF